MTVAEFRHLQDEGHQHELDEGELIVTSLPVFSHGRVQAQVAAMLCGFADERGLGEVAIGCGFRLSDETVRTPDVVFIRHERVPLLELDRYPTVAPDLAIEVLSPDVN